MLTSSLNPWTQSTISQQISDSCGNLTAHKTNSSFMIYIYTRQHIRQIQNITIWLPCDAESWSWTRGLSEWLAVALEDGWQCSCLGDHQVQSAIMSQKYAMALINIFFFKKTQNITSCHCLGRHIQCLTTHSWEGEDTQTLVWAEIKLIESKLCLCWQLVGNPTNQALSRSRQC